MMLLLLLLMLPQLLFGNVMQTNKTFRLNDSSEKFSKSFLHFCHLLVYVTVLHS